MYETELLIFKQSHDGVLEYSVYSKISGQELGIIRPVDKTKRFAFFPMYDSMFEALPMRDIAAFCEHVTFRNDEKNTAVAFQNKIEMLQKNGFQLMPPGTHNGPKIVYTKRTNVYNIIPNNVVTEYYYDEFVGFSDDGKYFRTVIGPMINENTTMGEIEINNRGKK